MSENSPTNMNTWPNRREAFSVNPETLFQKDEKGNLLPKANIENIKSPWKESIEIIKNIYIDLYKDKIVSIYVTGSVASGTTKENVSDIDMFAVSETEEVSTEDTKILKNKSFEALKQQGLIPPKLDLMIIPKSYVIGPNARFNRQFVAKLLSVSVYGEDFTKQLPEFRTNKETAINLVLNLDRDIAEVEQELIQAPDSRSVEKLCKWIMKKIVRQGFLLVMIPEDTYTISLETASILFAKHFPEKAELMKRAFELCSQPTSNKEEIKKVINGLGSWLGEKIEELKKS